MRYPRFSIDLAASALFYFIALTVCAWVVLEPVSRGWFGLTSSSSGSGGSGGSGGRVGSGVSGGSGGSSLTRGCDGAGNCYIRAGASGSGTGADWTNAYAGFGTGAGQADPSAMSRGATYWIAGGTYGGVTFNTPNSGAAVIAIEGATAANHGPAADWNASYAGEAVFGESTIGTSYWTFQGQSRGSDWRSGYTLKFWNQSDGSGAALLMGGNSNLTFDYVEIEGTGMTGGAFPNNTTADKCSTDNCGKWMDNGIYTTGAVSNLYVGHSYIHHTGNTQFQMNVGVNNGVTWEYDWISYNHTGQNGGHDEAYSLYGSNVEIRYNAIQDISGSGIITTAGAGQPQLENWDVYGNLIFWDPAYAAYNGQYWLAVLDNAIVDFLGEAMSGHVNFSNNTIAGMYNSEMDASGAAASTVAISGNNSNSGGSVCGSGGCPSVTIENNLWYGDGYVYGDSEPYCQVVSGASCTQNYNAAYQANVPSGSNWQTNDPPGPNDYNVSGTANPFVNSSASTIAGYELVTPDPFASKPGASLASPYNMDMLGVTRGANGTWDRGALQVPGTAASGQHSSAQTGASRLTHH